MKIPTGYILCATPRTGSTLLCDLLSSTDVLGSPESYFREADEATWARRFNLPAIEERVRDYPSFLRAVRAVGTTGNGIFAARVMWGSVQRVVECLGKLAPHSDKSLLESAFGPLAFVHLIREDRVAQAVSWARAEQSGYWHEGDVVRSSPQPELERMKGLLSTIQQHNSAWQAWFENNNVQPHRLTYEQLVTSPEAAISDIAALVRVAVPSHWQPASRHRKQADRTNENWSALLRAALPRPVAGS